MSDSCRNGDSTPACRQTTSADWTAEREKAHLVYTREGERKQGRGKTEKVTIRMIRRERKTETAPPENCTFSVIGCDYCILLHKN